MILFHTGHAVITDFSGIQIAAVAFPATDTNPVIEDAGTLNTHETPLPLLIIRFSGKDGQACMDTVILRTFTEEEYHLFFRGYEADPLVNPAPYQYNKEQVSRSYHYNHDGFQQGYVHFGIIFNNQPVGSFQLKRMNPKTKTGEFGIILQHDRWKDRGIGTAAILAGLQIAKDQFGLEKIMGDTMSCNGRMRHIFEKLGFQLIETVPDAFQLSNGKREDRLIYQKNISEREIESCQQVSF